MRIMMVGDIVGQPGRDAVADLMPVLREEHAPDVVVANGENAAGGAGITPQIATRLLEEGTVDVLTLGNHAWARREVYGYLDQEPRMLRPANYPEGAPGRGYGVYPTQAGPLAVVVLQGRALMDPVEHPFHAADAILEGLHGKAACVLVDFHAEATSEKQALGWYLDGRVSAVVGTHTHVQTADERVLPHGTAYITDVGMTGPTESIIGMAVGSVLPRFTSLLPSRFEVASGAACLNAVLVDVDETNGRAVRIVRIQGMIGEEGSA